MEDNINQQLNNQNISGNANSKIHCILNQSGINEEKEEKKYSCKYNLLILFI